MKCLSTWELYVKQDTRCFWVCTSVYFTEVLEVSPVQEVFTQSAYVNIIRIVRLATSLTLANSIKHRKMIRQICTWSENAPAMLYTFLQLICFASISPHSPSFFSSRIDQRRLYYRTRRAYSFIFECQLNILIPWDVCDFLCYQQLAWVTRARRTVSRSVSLILSVSSYVSSLDSFAWQKQKK